MIGEYCLRAVRARRGGARARGRARSGNVSVIVALSIPALATLVFGAVDVSSVLSDRSRMRSIADAAALSGARNLTVAMGDRSAAENARAMAQAMISEWRNAPALTTDVAVIDLPRGGKGVRVRLDARRPSLFGDLLPPGGWQYSATATAATVNSKPLCVLAFDDQKNRNFLVTDSAEIRAPECLVHSNGDIEVDGGSITAGQTQAVRDATGAISPQPITDAPPIEDPFEDRPLTSFKVCKGLLAKQPIVILNKGTHVLPAGQHCGVMDVSGTATLQLAPGEHHFQLGTFSVRGDARVTGDNVVLIFDLVSFFRLKDRATINLSGRESGVHAGFVVVGARGNARRFEIDSTRVERLDGVVYIPDAELSVSGQSDVARESDWTVLVSQRLTMSGNPRLYLNADYAGSQVTVPTGVGPRAGEARLVE